MNTPEDSSLGREVAYPNQYDPSLLFPIPRAAARAEIGIDDNRLPFIGHDRWHAYELSWLDVRGKPCVAVATFVVPCDSPYLIESKSLKLYLNSLNSSHFNSPMAVRERIANDLSLRAGAQVVVELDLPTLSFEFDGESLDGQDLEISVYGPPQARYLGSLAGTLLNEVLYSQLLKSNCPVTGQPDWASVEIRYSGAAIDRAGLLRYLVSFREHAEFHEQCVERIFHDLMQHCQPAQLSVEARYTRRGGLDINPWRATPGFIPPLATREPRQ